MSDTILLILKNIKEGKPLFQILSETGISYRSFLHYFKELESYGFNFTKYYFSDGNICFDLEEEEKTKPVVKTIIFNNENDQFKAMFIADLHYGHQNDRIDCIESAYNFAINNKIKHVFIVGDVFENTYTDAPLRLNTIDKQIYNFTGEFPCDKRVTSFVLYGNHDYYSLQKQGLDIASIVEKERPDLVSLGYGRSYVKINNDCICLEHECDDRKDCDLKKLAKVIFIGHSHMYKLYPKSKTEVFVPALSDAFPSNYSKQNIPDRGLLDVTFSFTEGGTMNKVDIKHYVDRYGLGLSSKTGFTVRTRKK